MSAISTVLQLNCVINAIISFFSVARKKVLFADGVAPGDESSSSGAEALRSPAKIAASKTRKKLRRKRTLKATGRKRLIDRLKLPVSAMNNYISFDLQFSTYQGWYLIAF